MRYRGQLCMVRPLFIFIFSFISLFCSAELTIVVLLWMRRHRDPARSPGSTTYTPTTQNDESVTIQSLQTASSSQKELRRRPGASTPSYLTRTESKLSSEVFDDENPFKIMKQQQSGHYQQGLKQKTAKSDQIYGGEIYAVEKNFGGGEIYAAGKNFGGGGEIYAVEKKYGGEIYAVGKTYGVVPVAVASPSSGNPGNSASATAIYSQMMKMHRNPASAGSPASVGSQGSTIDAKNNDAQGSWDEDSMTYETPNLIQVQVERHVQFIPSDKKSMNL